MLYYYYIYFLFSSMMGFMCYYGHVQNTSNLGEGNNLFQPLLKSLEIMKIITNLLLIKKFKIYFNYGTVKFCWNKGLGKINKSALI